LPATAQHRLLQGREPGELLVEQVGEAAKDHRVLGQEGADLTPEEVGDEAMRPDGK